MTCLLTPKQEKLYCDYLQSEQVQAALIGRILPFKAITRLRQICNHPALFRERHPEATQRPNGELVLKPEDGLFFREEYSFDAESLEEDAEDLDVSQIDWRE